MMQELIEETISNFISSPYEVAEIELGGLPYSIFIEEIQIYINADVKKVNYYRGIPITDHNTEGAILFHIREKPRK